MVRGVIRLVGLARLHKSRVVLREERTKSRRTVPSGVGGIKSVAGASGASHPIKPFSVERAPAGGVKTTMAPTVLAKLYKGGHSARVDTQEWLRSTELQGVGVA